MLCIAIVNSKGGVGKTTLCAALAVRAAADYKRVAVVDLDPQRSLAGWFGVRGSASSGPSIFADIEDADDARDRAERDGWDLCFLDGPPGHLNKVREMVRAADFVVIPVKPSSLDVLATVEAVEIARQEGVAHLAVLNDCDGRRLADEARDVLSSCKVPVASSEVKHRLVHVDAMGNGKTASEMGARASAAAEELEALWAEIKSAANKAMRARVKGRR